MIYVDFSNVFYQTLYSLDKISKDNEQQTGIPIDITLKALAKGCIRSIEWYKSQFSSEYGRIILCFDSKANWRKAFFPLYKAKRAEDKKKDDKDWDKIYKQLEELKKIIYDNSKFICLEVDGLEGDDIMSLSCKLDKNGKILIISADKDLNQLLDDPRIKQYSTRTGDFVEERHSLKELILKGDTSDGVPNIFSDDDHFVKEEKTRAKSVTSKMMESVDITSEESIRDFFKTEKDVETIVNNYTRNKKLVDLSMVPEEYEDKLRNNLKEAITHVNNVSEEKHDKFIKVCLDEQK